MPSKNGNEWGKFLDKLTENTSCYAKEVQRNVLLHLSENETIRDNFFLTGGTALSVFYLHHRRSIDIDLFSVNQPPFDRVEAWVKNEWPTGYTTLIKEPYILSVYLNGVKVDFVHDGMSFNDQKIPYPLDNNHSVFVDSLKNIASNKFCTLIGRQEPKDFIDFYFINKMKSLDINAIYSDARRKEGMFDDPPMVAYQVENNLRLIIQNPYAFPELLVNFDIDEFSRFYEDLIYSLYYKKEG
ncbi:MAG TPA: nucleotidyl transferase AbiEii/AbiGii toxin family protein [Candidatus Kapabacteria bacterium]|nr:nucleotidyl transferase AbiEii/AbiGii toxin family protein [Candidatus Kapabacteria bacterium]